MRKDDVTTSYHQGMSGPMVNVKVHGMYGADWAELGRRVEEEEGADGFAAWFEAWTDADEYGNGMEPWFAAACEMGFDMLQQYAEEIWPAYAVKVWPAGRSGGWAVVEGLPDVDDWDAVMLAKWARFEKWAREETAGIPYDVAALVCLNVYDREVTELERAAEAARMEIATVPA